MYVVNPYLTLNGNCREAMEFYKTALDAELMMQTVAESPMCKDMPADQQDKIMHASLSKEGTVLFMASDALMPGEFVKGTDFNLSLNCSSEEEIRTAFGKLSDGGTVIQPLQESFWGSTFAMIKDPFGYNWMLNFDKSRHPQA